VEQLVATRVSTLREGARRDYLLSRWAEWMAGGAMAVATVQPLATRGSLIGRFRYMLALWTNNERGRAADLLAALDAEVGESVVTIRRYQARFWVQQGMRQKARPALVALNQKAPLFEGAALELADLFSAEGWTEDQCAVLDRVHRQPNSSPDALLSLARCEASLGRDARAEAYFRELTRDVPLARGYVQAWADFLSGRGRLTEAEAALRRLLPVEPSGGWLRLQLAELLRRQGRLEEARVQLAEAAALSPDDSRSPEALGHIEYQAGDPQKALGHWRSALERKPDNESLAQRLDFLSPETAEPWQSDIPSESDLRAAVEE
jgi:tetratricopeptide (TPR) repeat protein